MLYRIVQYGKNETGFLVLEHHHGITSLLLSIRTRQTNSLYMADFLSPSALEPKIADWTSPEGRLCEP